MACRCPAGGCRVALLREADHLLLLCPAVLLFLPWLTVAVQSCCFSLSVAVPLFLPRCGCFESFPPRNEVFESTFGGEEVKEAVEKLTCSGF